MAMEQYMQDYNQYLINLMNPNSTFFRQQGQQFTNTLNNAGLTPEAYRSALASTGMGAGTAGNVGAKLSEADARRNRDAGNQFMGNMYASAGGLLNQGTGIASQHNLGQQEIDLARDQFEYEQDSGLLNQILNTAIGVGSAFIPGGSALTSLFSGGGNNGVQSSSNFNLGQSQMGNMNQNYSSQNVLPNYMMLSANKNNKFISGVPNNNIGQMRRQGRP